MNVMNKDAIDDKIKERCKNMWKIMHARGSRQIKEQSKNYRVEANLDGSNSYRESIKMTEGFDGSKIYQEAIEIAIKKSQKGLINSLAIERCPAIVEIA